MVVPRLTSSLASIITALLADEEPVLTWSKQATFGVVVAAEGYPETYAKGMVLPEITSPDVSVYYAGVAEKDGQLVASGGRLFLVEAQGDTLADAREKVYGALDGVDLPQMFYRKDIGAKALK